VRQVMWAGIFSLTTRAAGFERTIRPLIRLRDSHRRRAMS
jgi:hypothetical protein